MTQYVGNILDRNCGHPLTILTAGAMSVAIGLSLGVRTVKARLFESPETHLLARTFEVNCRGALREAEGLLYTQQFFFLCAMTALCISLGVSCVFAAAFVKLKRQRADRND